LGNYSLYQQLENLIKGLLIAKGMPATKDTEFNPDLGRHKLVDYFRKAQMRLSKEDKQLLTILTEMIESGKYPIQKKPQRRLSEHPYLRKADVDIVQHILELAQRVDIEIEKATTFHLPRMDFKLLH
jgi:hypothetical protein